MKNGLLCVALLIATGCGSTSTDNSGASPTPTAGAGFCSQFTPGTGLICDTATNPPTLKVNVGSGAGTVAAGDDTRFGSLDPNKGEFLGTFTPTVTQTANPTSNGTPGGLFTGHGGGIVYNAATGRIGIRAADEICASIVNWQLPAPHTTAVASAHACSNDELVQNTRAGKIPAGTTGWVFGSATSFAYKGTTVPGTNYQQTCGNWTYDSADLYVGTTFTVADSDPKTLGIPAGKALSIQFTTANAAPSCANVNAIACCE